MSKPTDKELEQALEAAGKMRESGSDPDYIAKSLLSLNYRFNAWQKVIAATRLYLHSGQGSTEHARLVKAINDAEALESRHEDGQRFGLE